MKTSSARLLAVLLALGPVLSVVGHAGGPGAAADDGLGIYAGNPYYWQYHGRPVLLLGGSSTPPGGLNDEGMFLWPNLPATLDKLKAAGGNYVRCLVSGRLRGETALWPFARKGDRYDLDQWNDEYWRLFEMFLQETRKLDIVTDVEIWATFDYYREPWTKNPFNPKNNINYTAEQTGLPTEVPSHPSRAQNTFFRTIPELNNIGAVLEYQQQFVDKILSYTLRHNHILYCMDNETMASPKWGAYWARYVRAAAEKAGRKVPGTEMFDPHDLRDPMYNNVIDHPELYSFVELAQNNHQKGETHYARILEVRRRVAASPRPLNNVKIYGVDGGQMGSSQEGMQRFWRNLFAGCASARFHEKHLGDSEPALRMIRSAREMTAAVDLFRCQPRNDLLSDREPNEAYCLAEPGRQYAVYFPAGGNVRLDLSGCAGEMELRWLDVDAARWSGPAPRRPFQKTVLDVPGPGQWVAVLTAGPVASASASKSAKAAGPLRVHPTNPRYFTDGAKNADGSLKAVYLTGSHTWNNLIDMDKADPPAPFDFAAYLDFLQRYGHNFIRLWTWDSVTWDTHANRGLGKEFVHHVAPLPWARSGLGNARDGKPKFDLTKFNPEYFNRLRTRVQAAGEKGIYVSVMLFEGWGLSHADHRIKTSDAWAYRSHPFHPDNNVNGITGDLNGDGNALEVHSLANPAITALQTAYIRKVVDTVNDLDNVLYEVINEGGNKEWNWWVVRTVHDYERTKPKQHPVGITGNGGERLVTMRASPADWVSPGDQDGYRDPPPAWDGRKVSLLDTDHLWGVGGNAAWAWKSLLRGHNPIFMDPYDGSILGNRFDPQFEPVRRALGHTRRLAERVNLAAMTPHSELASTQFCSADPGKEYLVYVPEGREAKVDLSAAPGPLQVEWIHPVEGTTQQGGEVTGGAERMFKAPFSGDAVLYLRAGAHSPSKDKPQGTTAGQVNWDWPTATPESQGMSSERLNALKDSLAARKTTGFLVVRNDKIVYEWYAPGQGPTTKHYTASMAKAIVGGVSFGVAVTDGLIALDDRAAKYVPQWRDDPRKAKITLRQLGSHTSGVEDAEADGLPHDKLTGWKGDFWKQPAVPRDPFTLARDAAPIMFEPGSKSAYSNPGIAMLTYCTTAALREAPIKDIRTLLRDRVMRPLGVPDSDWSAGYGKTFVVDGLPLVGSWGGGAYTARATARVGQLMLHGGTWEGRQWLSKDAVRQITSDAGTPGSGAIGWWSNNSGECVKLPRDAFWGAGAGHQIVLVVPSLNLVAVRNGEMLNAPGDGSREFNKPVHRFLFEPLVEAISD